MFTAFHISNVCIRSETDIYLKNKILYTLLLFITIELTEFPKDNYPRNYSTYFKIETQ